MPVSFKSFHNKLKTRCFYFLRIFENVPMAEIIFLILTFLSASIEAFGVAVRYVMHSVIPIIVTESGSNQPNV